jgi:hypothetical protein
MSDENNGCKTEEDKTPAEPNEALKENEMSV